MTNNTVWRSARSVLHYIFSGPTASVVLVTSNLNSNISTKQRNISLTALMTFSRVASLPQSACSFDTIVLEPSTIFSGGKYLPWAWKERLNYNDNILLPLLYFSSTKEPKPLINQILLYKYHRPNALSTSVHRKSGAEISKGYYLVLPKNKPIMFLRAMTPYGNPLTGKASSFSLEIFSPLHKNKTGAYFNFHKC